jgi:hypothetical protein
MSKYLELRKINVNDNTEKKGRFTYLSWAWAVDQLLQLDPMATWEYKEPMKFGDSMMVFCTVTAFGKNMTAQLPVMNNQNKSMINPDSFAVNTAMQRCLAKAIALHGLGLYIYAGEDLPEDEEPPKVSPPKISAKPEETPVGCTPQQISSINSLVDQTQSDIAKLCAFFKKPSIALLDRLQANQAIEMLNKKLFDQELENRSLNSLGQE